MDQKAINVIRNLALDMITNTGAGHPEPRFGREPRRARTAARAGAGQEGIAHRHHAHDGQAHARGASRDG